MQHYDSLNPIKKIRGIIFKQIYCHPLAMTIRGKFVRSATRLRKMDFEDIICVQNIPHIQRENLVSVDIGGKLFVVHKELAVSMNLPRIDAAWTEKMHQAHRRQEEKEKKKILARRRERDKRIREKASKKRKEKERKQGKFRKFEKFMEMQKAEKREKREKRKEELRIEREKKNASRNSGSERVKNI